MFDIGFSEILVIFVLALIVLGPEKLPRVVRTVGRWVGRARAMARQFQEQLEDEMDFESQGARSAPPPVSPDPVYTEPSVSVVPQISPTSSVTEGAEAEQHDAAHLPTESHEPRA